MRLQSQAPGGQLFGSGCVRRQRDSVRAVDGSAAREGLATMRSHGWLGRGPGSGAAGTTQMPAYMPACTGTVVRQYKLSYRLACSAIASNTNYIVSKIRLWPGWTMLVLWGQIRSHQPTAVGVRRCGKIRSDKVVSDSTGFMG